MRSAFPINCTSDYFPVRLYYDKKKDLLLETKDILGEKERHTVRNERHNRGKKKETKLTSQPKGGNSKPMFSSGFILGKALKTQN